MEGKGKKIVFIEDESRLQEVFKTFFEERGYKLFSAYDGENGLKLAESEMPDLIILDLILPKKNGFDVLKELKENPRLKDIPVIVLTNLEGGQDIERAFSLGAKAYLIKSNYNLDELIEKIEELTK